MSSENSNISNTSLGGTMAYTWYEASFFSCHLYTIRHKLVQMHSVMKFPQALYFADYLSRKGLCLALHLQK